MSGPPAGITSRMSDAFHGHGNLYYQASRDPRLFLCDEEYVDSVGAFQGRDHRVSR